MSEIRQNTAMFDLWVRACEEFSTRIYPLEGSGDHAIYKTWSEYQAGNSFFRTDPVYRVWIRGDTKYCGMSLQAAYSVWEREK